MDLMLKTLQVYDSVMNIQRKTIEVMSADLVMQTELANGYKSITDRLVFYLEAMIKAQQEGISLDQEIVSELTEVLRMIKDLDI